MARTATLFPMVSGLDVFVKEAKLFSGETIKLACSPRRLSRKQRRRSPPPGMCFSPHLSSAHLTSSLFPKLVPPPHIIQDLTHFFTHRCYSVYSVMLALLAIKHCDSSSSFVRTSCILYSRTAFH